MSDPVRFLNAMAHAFGTMALYPEGHPARERVVDAAFTRLEDLQSVRPTHVFTCLDDEVIYGTEPLTELQSWEWAPRLAGAGLGRIEFERRLSRDEFNELLADMLSRLSGTGGDTSEARQMRSLGVRFGRVALKGDVSEAPAEAPPALVATLGATLGEEADTFRWVQHQIIGQGSVPLFEAQAVVRSLAVAMHGERRVLLPLLKLKEFDQYTTTHSLNVSVLSMGLAESLGLRPRDVRAIGVAGLLHDIGKVRIPLEILTKPGKLTPQERRLMNCHPQDGARLLLQSDDDMEMPAIVAYEHHIMLNGGGYPALHYNRACTTASRLVHVCDVYDALCTDRPYRGAWSSVEALAYLERRAGVEFDPDIVATFARLLREGELQVREFHEETHIIPAEGTPAAQAPSCCAHLP